MIPRVASGGGENQRRKAREPDGVKLRVSNMQRMKAFYRHALGFALIGEFPNAALLELAETDGGRAQAIGLFKCSVHLRRGEMPAARISFSITLADCGSRRRRLEQLGFLVDANDPGRLCLHDPEGNRVELICRDRDGR